MTEFLEKNYKRKGLGSGHLTEKIGNRKHGPEAWEQQTEAHTYEEKGVTTDCGWTDRPTKPEGQTHTSFNMPHIQENDSNTASWGLFTVRLVWTIFCSPKCLFPIIVSFCYICISQGSVAMQLRCGRIFNNCVIANCPQSAPVKEF